ncbi:suppressor protein of bem1/bed5 double mutants-like isoform X2 [Prosopis cineraria]|uniref:suppressor protein of bem1/bed5 double mutants-like isoform X2 n=1 Tax=Prosopis cineraria TaxID=364024 RepID=UPI00240EA84B|nr:suppressor protein of bem1/bed5 double mutants-like isoform X2 [Prosopis cineraria]
MEHSQVLLSALSIGVGVGARLGLSSRLGWNLNSSEELWNEQVEQELLRNVIDGKECQETFQDFPYYLSETTRELLMNAAFVHLKQLHFSRHIQSLLPASRAIILSGPEELYMQTIAKALAHHFQSKLLLLDIVDFTLKIKRKYGCAGKRKEPSFKRSLSKVASKRLHSLFGSLSTSENEAPLENKSNMCIDEKLFMKLLHKVLASISKKSSIILYVRDVEMLLQSKQLYNLFHEILKKLSGPILILGSQVIDVDNEIEYEWSQDYIAKDDDERLAALFPYKIKIKHPKDENNLQNWESQLEENEKKIQSQDNQNHIAKVLAEIDVECKDLNSINHEETEILSRHIEEIVVSAISHYLMNTKDLEYVNGRLVISYESLCHGLDLFRKSDSVKDTEKQEASLCHGLDLFHESDNVKDTEKQEADGKEDVSPDNKYEKNIRSELIPAREIRVTFSDIGALDEIKESLQELIMLPLKRPDLFKGGLLKPCRGILLFGPPGTGKTMLAKAIANEAGASFINVSMSTITSMWYGEAEKHVRALFSLASKVSPTIIFIDEVDSLLGQRSRCGEHEATRSIKNEFMTHWDGLLTKQDEQILVLAATNRPFDLDDAIIRRFQRRIMVGLPSVEAREIILKTLLAKENTENLDFIELALMTEGYTGSDIQNLCTVAAYRPIRELIKQERLKDMEKNKKDTQGQSLEVALCPIDDAQEQEKNKKEVEDQSSKATSRAKEDKEHPVITLRPINMEDMIQAKNQVPASFDAHGLIMRELKQWNKLYGERGL